MTDMDNAFLQARIDATRARIIALEDAALGISSGAIESYKLDTGQSAQSVTKSNIKLITDTISSLYNLCSTLETRLNGSGTHTGRPCF